MVAPIVHMAAHHTALFSMTTDRENTAVAQGTHQVGPCNATSRRRTSNSRRESLYARSNLVADLATSSGGTSAWTSAMASRVERLRPASQASWIAASLKAALEQAKVACDEAKRALETRGVVVR